MLDIMFQNSLGCISKAMSQIKETDRVVYIPTLGMRMGKNHEFEVSLGYEETTSKNKSTTLQLKKILKDLPN